jgi:PTH1 family peptidyl-tRNA hydrolase
MQWIIGLGNPGKRYEGTRHNVGFEVVDRLADHLKIAFRAGRGEFMWAEGEYRDQPMTLVKPMTYMNESGIAAAEIREQFDVALNDFLVVCDDFQLPLGRVRLRLSGSDGGHNGLYSIIYHLQSEDFARLRCGIGSEHTPVDKTSMAEYVLDSFAEDERPAAAEMVDRAKEACLSVVIDGIEKTMNRINGPLLL